ncbi:hypothetical protein J6590_027237 [Homalodisca vitripennis]|nr:hypothetical protein J6590_027237 [Homalodisca vitripennis]
MSSCPTLTHKVVLGYTPLRQDVMRTAALSVVKLLSNVIPTNINWFEAVTGNICSIVNKTFIIAITRTETQPEQTPEITGTKPLFISLLTDALATEGDTTSLECAVRGDPTPSVSWFLNNNPVVASDRLKMDQEAGGLCTLVISPVLADDRGVYTARATNPLGEAKCFAHLIVRSAANLAAVPSAPDVRLEERATVPAFTELFADRTVVEGGSTKFECIVTGKPTPKVSKYSV